MERKNVIRIAALIAAGALLVPGTGHARIDDTCGRGGRPIQATMTEPQGGHLTVVTAATGPVALDAAGNSVVISTTGQVPVTIEYSCIMDMTLTITKNSPISGSGVQTETWTDADLNGASSDAPCAEATVGATADIGLDGGEYTFELTGTGCNGAPMTPTAGGMIIGDPPLGI